MIEGLKKHQGILKNTGHKVAVVFRELPTEPSHCLIVETERLPDSYHDYVIQLLNSRESTETNNFFEVLSRRSFPDGTNCLTSLHQRGFLRKEPVTNITMIPLPGQSVPLELINATINKKVDEYTAAQARLAMGEKVDEKGTVKSPEDYARDLIATATALEAEATAKREEAYAILPELKPSRGRPTLEADKKILSEEERKAKRRERDRLTAASKREAKKADSLDAKVAAKIARDQERLSAGV